MTADEVALPVGTLTGLLGAEAGSLLEGATSRTVSGDDASSSWLALALSVGRFSDGRTSGDVTFSCSSVSSWLPFSDG